VSIDPHMTTIPIVMTPVGHAVYLHGFASSPGSSKATRFGRELTSRGVGFDCPDLNEPAFETLTVTRMLREAALVTGEAGAPVAMIGSSLGAFVAVHAAARDTTGKIDRLVLLAPALDFDGNRLSELGDRGLAAWKSSNQLAVFHYGYGRMMPVHYDLYADARRYSALQAEMSQPVQVFQGRFDTAVNPDTVERWARSRPNVELHMLDDDHQLLKSLDGIWREMEKFLW